MNTLNSWLDIAADSDFSIYNLPFGVFSVRGGKPGLGVAIGEYVIDLYGLAALGVFDDLLPDREVLNQPYLNDFMALGKGVTAELRLRLQAWLCDTHSELYRHQELLFEQKEVSMHLPVKVGDYTDFYSSIEHATNVGKMFRDPENALLPNWRHLPVAYHGRASSIVVSGTPVRRPWGQVLPKGASQPVFQPSARLDFELEMAFVIGKNSQLGKPIPIGQAGDYLFGLVLFNDWSARDIQKWEYVPLGPFLGKNFASSISPWVVPMEALAPFRVTGPQQQPPVLPYLQYEGEQNYDIALEVGLRPEGGEETVISRTNFRYMYWNMVQQLAHHTVNGCNVRVGDLMASGTISGPDPHSYGSLLELAWAGSRPLQLAGGESRSFLQDGDTLSLRGHAQKNGMRVGFGEVSGKILPAMEG
ncbi:MAG: fumarylacetoacetase [Bacteroidetes bacterium]|nr:MAG: fumarylacetoacetase [Bacteroidota bacterium]